MTDARGGGMNRLRFLWGQVGNDARIALLIVLLAAVGLGGVVAVSVLGGGAALMAVWVVGYPTALVIASIVGWISTQLTDYEDPPEPQKPGVEPDPFEEQP